MLAEAQSALPAPLPISSVLGEVAEQVRAAHSAVLVSPPGTGKTTLAPLALADLVHDLGGNGPRVVLAEPRRIAARAAARRMAELLGEPVGERVGFTVRGERRVSGRTRVEVVTTGVLVQRLQRDAELPGVGAVVLDECHERHLDTDLALAFLLETQAALRPDLLLLAASATADADRLARLMAHGREVGDWREAGGRPEGVPVIGADAPMFDVATVWCPPEQPVAPSRGLRVDPRLLDHVAVVVRRALREGDGDVLVFLPGEGEIGGVANRLRRTTAVEEVHGVDSADGVDGVEVLRLFGRMSGWEQDAVLAPHVGGRRVVLSTAVAESSLTVPGVRVVVDAGLARVPRVDLARGLGALATVRVSRSVAHQRAGRAGREAPGWVYRCWSEGEHQRLPAHSQPEIESSDLTGFALALAWWGDPDAASLPLLDPPPAAAMAVARETLRALGAVGGDGRVTGRGRVFAAAGVHPRLARALLDGAELVGRRRAAEVVAILSDDSVAAGTDDLARAWRQLRTGSDPASRRWRDETQRLSNLHPPTSTGQPTRTGRPPQRHEAAAPRRPVGDDLAAGIIAGLAYPERLARLRAGSTDTYLMTGGTGAQLSPGSGLASAPWLAVAVAERQAGAPSARVRLAAAVDQATAVDVGVALVEERDEVAWREGEVVARHVERMGAVVLGERRLMRPDPALVAAALREGLRREGFRLLSVSFAASKLWSRMAFCRWALGPEWPDVAGETLLGDDPENGLQRWIGVWLAGARSVADLRKIDLVQAFRGLLDYRQLAILDQVAPEWVTLPDGKRGWLTYSGDRADPGPPVLAVRLQAVLGWTRAPVVAVEAGRPASGVPVVLHLLSPANRPLAVTSDLESFWRNGYPEVRAQMRGRYPKHAWPEDPLPP